MSTTGTSRGTAERQVDRRPIGRSKPRGLALARGAVNYYVFGALTEVWINVNLEPGTVELQDVVNRLPSGPLATLDHLPADFEDVVAWARMVKELSKGE